MALDLSVDSTLINNTEEHFPLHDKTGAHFFLLDETMSEYYRKKPVKLSGAPENTDDEFFGESCSVRHIEGEYFFSYISGAVSYTHLTLPTKA